MLNWLNDFPSFPVSENADFQNWETANPHGYSVFPVSQFSQLKNKGSAQQQDETADTCEKKPAPIPEPQPDLSDAVAARLELATPSPTPEDVAELDALMVELCALEPWLAGYLPEMQTARRSMAPVNVAESLTSFRQYVREAEAKRGAVLGVERGKLPRPESLTVNRQHPPERKPTHPERGSSWAFSPAGNPRRVSCPECNSKNWVTPKP